MSYASEVLADSPAGYYRCQEASGLILDSSGNGRNATASSGTAQYQQASPILSDPADFAIYFDGDASFSVPDVGLDFGNVFSLEAWIKRTTSGIFEQILFKGINAYDMHISSGNRIVVAKAGVGDIAQSSTSITDTSWHHCVVTKNAAVSANVYIDAVDVTSFILDQTCTDTASALVFGDDTFADFSNSRMDEFALYPTVLSQARITAHYNAAFSTAGPGDNPPIGFLGRGAGW